MYALQKVEDTMNTQEHYLFLSSQDSLAYFPNNKAHSFTVKLPGTLKLSGHWKCAVVEMVYVPQFQGEKPKQLYLCCDLVQESYGSNSMLPILRKVSVPSAISTKTVLTFPQNYYFDVSQEEVQYIQVYAKDQTLRDPSFMQEPLTCTLHLVRVY
jgi:hypothetical protein